MTTIARGERRPFAIDDSGQRNPLMPSLPGKPLIPARYFDANTSGLTAEVQDMRINEIHFDLQSQAVGGTSN